MGGTEANAPKRLNFVIYDNPVDSFRTAPIAVPGFDLVQLFWWIVDE